MPEARPGASAAASGPARAAGTAPERAPAHPTGPPARSRSGGPGSRAGDAPPRLVRKRDGRAVPFDRRRIASAVARAMAAVGERDPQFADEVAIVVELALSDRARARGPARHRPPGDPDAEWAPGIEEIQDLVETALIELGRAAVAKAYILYRDRRARVRGALSVGDEAAELARAYGDSVEREAAARIRVHERGRSSGWSRARIVAALLEEADLDRDLAERVAARVERRVVESGLDRLGTGLIRELVDNELVALGETEALRRQKSIGVPRHDLRRILAGEARDGREAPAAERVASEVLSRYLLEDVLSEASAEHVLSGDLFVEDLGRPELGLSCALPAELCLRGEPGPGAAFEMLEEIADLARGVSRGVVIEEPGFVLQPLARGTRAGSPLGLSAWLRSVAALARATGRRIDLGSPGSRFRAFTARLVEDLADADPAEGVPRLFLDGGELAVLLTERPDLEDALDRLLDEGTLVPSWSRGDELFAGPGCRRGPRERSLAICGGAVALHLPRLARRSGAWREDLALESLAGWVQCALGAISELARFQRELGVARPAGMRARVSYAIVPVGLRDALRVLGDGSVDPGQGARLLGVASEVAHRWRASAAPPVLVSTFFGERAAARFGERDAEDARARTAEPNLFGERSGPPRAPKPGLWISPLAGREEGEAEAVAARTLPAGAIDLSARPGSARAIDHWRAFHRAQRESDGGSVAWLFPNAEREPEREADA